MRKVRPKLTAARYAERFEAEMILQQRRYCDAFALWKDCANKFCLRQRACCGNQRACIARAVKAMPREPQWRAREAILAAMPESLGGPERQARLLMPRDFYDGTADRYVIGELKRLRKTGMIIQGGDNVHTLRLRFVDAGR
jgi:hypothetical protein